MDRKILKEVNMMLERESMRHARPYKKGTIYQMNDIVDGGEGQRVEITPTEYGIEISME